MKLFLTIKTTSNNENNAIYAPCDKRAPKGQKHIAQGNTLGK